MAKGLKLQLLDPGDQTVKVAFGRPWCCVGKVSVGRLGCLSDMARNFFLHEALSPTPETEIKGDTPLGEKSVPEDLV